MGSIAAVTCIIAAFAIQTVSRKVYLESRPHGWYVTLTYTQARGAERETFLWDGKHLSRDS